MTNPRRNKLSRKSRSENTSWQSWCSWSETLARGAQGTLFPCRHAFCQPKWVQKKSPKYISWKQFSCSQSASGSREHMDKYWNGGPSANLTKDNHPHAGGRGWDCSPLPSGYCPVWIGRTAKGSPHGTLARYARMGASAPRFYNLTWSTLFQKWRQCQCSNRSAHLKLMKMTL